MSESHAHGIHDHFIEQQAHKGVSLSQYVAICTAILSVLIAFISHKSHHYENQAFFLKNEALRLTNHAANQWGYYQAKTSRAHLALLASQLLTNVKADAYRKSAERYLEEASQIKAKATEFEEQATQTDKAGDEKLHIHHNFAQALILLHIAIALGAVTALTHKRWLFYITLVTAAGGCLLAFLA